MSQKNTLSELKVEEKRLEAEKEKQLDIKKDIEEKAVYVNTKAYIEDMAKKLGLVYPDEVIFKPEED